MNKKFYYLLDDGRGESNIMDLSSCMEWIKGDMEANYPDAENLPEEDLPAYTLTPVFMTAEEYDALPDQ